MKLRDILMDSSSLNDYDVVYAKRPWSLDSDACVIRYRPDDRVPRQLSEASFEYFLEAPLILDIWVQVEAAGKPASEVLDVLLYYAENDAFPS